MQSCPWVKALHAEVLNGKGCYWKRAKQYTSKNSIRPFWDPERKALMMTLLMLWVGLVGSYCILQRLPWQHQGKQEVKTSPTAEKNEENSQKLKIETMIMNQELSFNNIKKHLLTSMFSSSVLKVNLLLISLKKLTEQTWVTNWWYRCAT